MSYEEISAELDQKFTELGQNFGWVRPQTGPELGVKFWIKNPGYALIQAFFFGKILEDDCGQNLR